MRRLLALLLIIVRLALHKGGDGPGNPIDPSTGKPGAGGPTPATNVAEGQQQIAAKVPQGKPAGRTPRRRPSRVKDPEVPKVSKAPRRDPDGPVPANYRQVGYGETPESQLAQAARLRDGNRDNLYGGATFRDSQGNTYEIDGRADSSKHAEGDLLKKMRQEIADRQGISPEQVDLRTELRDVNLYVEFSPCPTGNRCQDMLDQYLPAGSQIQYSWPWQPRSAKETSQQNLSEAVTDLFTRKRPGPQ